MLHLSLFCNFHNKSKFEIEKEEKNEPQKPTELYTRLEFYQNKLLQIDWRNRSLNLHRIYNKWCFDLARLMIYDNTIVDKVVQSVLSNKKLIRIISEI
jgi:hypothetical protein